MHERGSVLFFFLMLLIVLVVGVLGVEQKCAHDRQQRVENFERLVRGVGFGPATYLSGCAFSFDPRLDGHCEADCGLIPGGACFCPRHTTSMLYYPPLPPLGQVPLREGGNGTFP
jgi:hypothetical protein